MTTPSPVGRHRLAAVSGVFCAVLFLCFFLPTRPAAASQDDARELAQHWRLEPIEWKGELAPGAAVAVVNHHGNVQVRGAGDGEVELVGNRQRHADDPRLPEVVVERGDDGRLRLEMHYPPDAPGAVVPDTWRRRRVDITVYVPEATPLEVETLHGRARLKGLGGDVHARSVSGDLQIVTAGTVDARSDHGDVLARLGSGTWERPPSLETLTGAIRVEVPWDADFRAVLETRGAIASDYSTELEWLEGTLVKRAVVVAGEGRSSLGARSARGDVRLVRTPKPEKN